MAQNEEFFNFEEALEELRLKEEELKKLVSEGEIRAFREGDTMRLRKTDVENLKGELFGGEVVLDGGDDLVFEDDTSFDDPGMATEEISEMDTLLEDDVEDVGEIDLDEVETVGAPVTATRRSAVVQEPESEGMGMRVMAILSTVLLILAIPVVLSFSRGSVGDMARSIASIAGTFEE
ncbi:MAG: hypothetical protein WD226_10635 [Planctomycetota bacterium]